MSLFTLELLVHFPYLTSYARHNLPRELTILIIPPKVEDRFPAIRLHSIMLRDIVF